MDRIIFRDPVCGAPVEASFAAASCEFAGLHFHFCSTQCRQAFEADPRKFFASDPPRPRPPCCGFGGGVVRRTVQRGAA